MSRQLLDINEALDLWSVLPCDHTVAIVKAYQRGCYTMADIARYFDVHRFTVGKIMTKRAADKTES